MKIFFNFRDDRYNYWPIYEAIKTYYPIGVPRFGSFFTYPGLKRLEDIVVENIHVGENYKNRWLSFEHHIREGLGKDVVGTTYGQAPSFSSYIDLEKIEIDQYVLKKELHFCVSLVGPFYTVYGIHCAFFGKDFGSKGERKLFYNHTLQSVVSPTGEFGAPFTQTRKLIEERFEGCKFVPYHVNRMYIEGLFVNYRDERKNCVFHALFNDAFDFESRIVGDTHTYGNEQWLVDNPNWENYWHLA